MGIRVRRRIRFRVRGERDEERIGIAVVKFICLANLLIDFYIVHLAASFRQEQKARWFESSQRRVRWRWTFLDLTHVELTEEIYAPSNMGPGWERHSR